MQSNETSTRPLFKKNSNKLFFFPHFITVCRLQLKLKKIITNTLSLWTYFNWSNGHFKTILLIFKNFKADFSLRMDQQVREKHALSRIFSVEYWEYRRENGGKRESFKEKRYNKRTVILRFIMKQLKYLGPVIRKETLENTTLTRYTRDKKNSGKLSNLPNELVIIDDLIHCGKERK